MSVEDLKETLLHAVAKNACNKINGAVEYTIEYIALDTEYRLLISTDFDTRMRVVATRTLGKWQVRIVAVTEEEYDEFDMCPVSLSMIFKLFRIVFRTFNKTQRHVVVTTDEPPVGEKTVLAREWGWQLVNFKFYNVQDMIKHMRSLGFENNVGTESNDIKDREKEYALILGQVATRYWEKIHEDV